ncbi:KipI family sensor histidine kinase inhibitor [Actinoplanes tereljensis]|uniref:Allophanate hydrolase n=1 Tax=Paractinoplanes tereljensis TaxID=571912 RepID=A0A919NUZ4_9ACTN|nr:allophanate hydrolase subunit 1 [Actinoplanes tereljensis]GIF24838.1 allophanate hydrolase [Actinoplanes tereljensis]
MRVLPAGPSALVIECRDGEQVEAWRAEFWRRRESGELTVTDIVPGARTVLLDGVAPGTAELLGEWPEPDFAQLTSERQIEISTTFDGEDLPDVASHWGVSVPEAVDRLVNAELIVAFCGFAPGFAYMRGLPEEWSVPRLAAPRPRVPAGAVGLAGPYAGIYPTASPGGWRLVGHTGQELFDVRAEPPALLTPGTRVRLVPA